MKHSSSSARLWALAMVVVLLSPAPWMVRLSDASTAGAQASATSAAASVSFERQQRQHHRAHPHHNARPPSWCRHCGLHEPPPQPPPLQDQGEVDPRYGVEERLVPTGPNPLHN